jgi:hypothetical protein
MIPPSDFICPITNTLMIDPVVNTTGVSYERQAILQWLNCHIHCPKTGDRIHATSLRTNTSLQWKIRYWTALNNVDTQNEKRSSQTKQAVPRYEFICPLTGKVMVDPVMTKYGHNYERTALVGFVDLHGVCPMTGKTLFLSGMISNKKLQWEIKHDRKDKEEAVSRPQSDTVEAAKEQVESPKQAYVHVQSKEELHPNASLMKPMVPQGKLSKSVFQSFVKTICMTDANQDRDAIISAVLSEVGRSCEAC